MSSSGSGPGLHFVQYPVRGGELYNQVAVFRSAQYARGQAEWGTPDELDRTFAHTCEGVQVALPSIQRDRRWPMYDRLPAATWSAGRISLLGDAAHPMLQYLTQGACQALLDGGALARVIPSAGARTHVVHTRSHQGPGGLSRSSPGPSQHRPDHRAHLGRHVARRSRRPMALRDEAFRLRSPRDYRHIDWLYGETV